MAVWPRRFLIDEGIPAVAIQECLTRYECVPCTRQSVDPAIVEVAYDLHAVLISADNDFRGIVRRDFQRGSESKFKHLRAVLIDGDWYTARAHLEKWEPTIEAIILTAAPNREDQILIEIGPAKVYVTVPLIR